MKILLRFTWLLLLFLQTAACFPQKAMDLYPVSLGGKWGYIDKQGHIVIGMKYEHASFDLYKTLNVVTDSKGYMLIDNADKPLTGDHYQSLLHSYGTRFISVQDSTGLWGCIDTTGKLVIPYQYAESIYFSGGIASVKKNGVPGYYDLDLHFRSLEGFDDVYAANEGFMIVTNGTGKNRRQGVFDTKAGNLTVQPVFYSVDLVKNGHAVVTKPRLGGNGIIDVRTGKLTVKPRKKQMIFTSTRNSDIGPEIVLDNLYSIERRHGDRITDVYGKLCFKYGSRYPDEGIGGFYNGYAFLYRDDLEGLVDTTGKVIIEPAYDRLSFVIDGLVSVNRNKKWGIVDTSARVIVPIEFDGAFIYKDLICCFANGDPSSGDIGTITYRDRNGNLVWPTFSTGEKK